MLFLGRVTRQKGPEYFIDVARRVADHVPAASSSSPALGILLPGMIERAVELDLADRMHFAGAVKATEVDRLYRAADVCVMPSVSEPLGLVALESLRNGTPCVIPKIGRVAEVLRHAMRVDYWDVDDMADKVIGLLEHPQLWEELSEAGWTRCGARGSGWTRRRGGRGRRMRWRWGLTRHPERSEGGMPWSHGSLRSAQDDTSKETHPMPDSASTSRSTSPTGSAATGSSTSGPTRATSTTTPTARILRRVADKCYLPTNRLLTEAIRRSEGRFRIAMSLSGVLMDQLEADAPDALASFQELVATGGVELLGETFHHSLSALRDPEEFRAQVRMHGATLGRHFGQRPTVFRNTELIYDDAIAPMVAATRVLRHAGRGADHVLGWRSPNYVYERRRRPACACCRGTTGSPTMSASASRIATGTAGRSPRTVGPIGSRRAARAQRARLHGL